MIGFVGERSDKVPVQATIIVKAESLTEPNLIPKILHMDLFWGDQPSPDGVF